MTRSLQAFLEGLIDYAGLFPPARLPMDAAVARWAAVLHEPFSLAVARFICPASRLDEFAQQARPRLGPSERWPVSLLATPVERPEDVVSALQSDLRAMADVERASDGRLHPAAVEMRLPAAAAEEFPPLRLADLLGAAAETVAGTLGDRGRLFVEAALPRSWAERTPVVVAALADCAPGAAVERPGFKLRCGGLEPAAFPPVERVALTLDACDACGVPFKATAGLHHPVRALDPGVGVEAHGFLNVFGAGILLAAGAIGRDELVEVLAERDAAAFAFDDDAFAWRGARAPVEAIRRARAERVTSFGSCSVDEPWEDLASLGLLPAPRAG
ncbi:MAG: hypothetical protein D6738_11370 [Acidobacteria bacterium]|nr:MAG: hypothetical protein D6738_11370 [Acidobacteriota bacterium]